MAEEKKEERPKSVSVVGVLPEEEELIEERVEAKVEEKGKEKETPGVMATPAVRALARELGVKYRDSERVRAVGQHYRRGPEKGLRRRSEAAGGRQGRACREGGLKRIAEDDCEEPYGLPEDDRICHRHG